MGWKKQVVSHSKDLRELREGGTEREGETEGSREDGEEGGEVVPF